jgi:hypothetical protein
MNISDIKLSLCKYRVENMQIEIPGYDKPHEVNPAFIMSIYIEQDFDRYYFPYFQMTLAIPNYVYRDMLKNNSELKAILRMQYAYYPAGESSVDENKINFFDYINSKFYIFMQDATPDLVQEYREEYEKNEDLYKNGSMGISDLSVIQIALYNEQYLFQTKVIVNDIITQCTLTDALTHVLNKAQLTNVLMSPANNGNRYNEFIIPPITVLKNIDRICNTYAMHNNGTVIFYGIDTLYILDKTPKCTAWRTNENRITYLTSFTRNRFHNALTIGCFSHNTEKYNVCNIANNAIAIETKSLLNDQVIGNSFMYFNSGDGSIKNVDSGAASYSKANKLTNIVMNTEGEDTSSSLKNSLKESSRVITVGLSGVNINMLTPNKEFIFTFDSGEYSKITGNYRLTKEAVVLKKSGNVYDVSATCIFKG